MNSVTRIASCFILGVAIQGAVYLYLDQYYFAPTANFTLSGVGLGSKDSGFPPVKEGKSFLSFDGSYMAVVKGTEAVDLYKKKDKTPTSVNLEDHSISLFRWMPDRNLALMGLYGGPNDTVILARLDPDSPDHTADTRIKDLPEGSKIVDLAYSTATNVVYMKVHIGEGRDRVYRTDANYDTRRIHVQATEVGNIATFYDEDVLIYDNARKGIVYKYYDKTGSWDVINPRSVGKYRLIGVADKKIYLAALDGDGAVKAVLWGELGKGFHHKHTYDQPQTLSSLTVAAVKDLSYEED